MLVMSRLPKPLLVFSRRKFLKHCNWWVIYIAYFGGKSPVLDLRIKKVDKAQKRDEFGGKMVKGN